MIKKSRNVWQSVGLALIVIYVIDTFVSGWPINGIEDYGDVPSNAINYLAYIAGYHYLLILGVICLVVGKVKEKKQLAKQTVSDTILKQNIDQ